MSVTYGAGGGTSKHTVKIATDIKKQYGVTSMAHLTCVSSSEDTVKNQIEIIRDAGIENILALRGDIPAETEFPMPGQFKHASDLVHQIKNIAPDICIGGACYPEGHPEADDKTADIANIKKKVDAGCEFLTTQMFFDNSIFYNYLYRLREAGIFVDWFGDESQKMQQAGIAYATEQIIDLFANGIKNVHVYTMNNPEVALGIQNNLSEIIGK